MTEVETAMHRKHAIPPLHLSLICLLSLLPGTFASARDSARCAALDPELRRWFREQTSPATGIPCCSEADGEFAEEEIRYDTSGVGHYWTRWSAHPQWMQVPDSAIIRDPNKLGRPVVWWGRDSLSDTYFIRCYAVGSGA